MNERDVMSIVHEYVEDWEDGHVSAPDSIKRIMELFREEVQTGAEGLVNRLVGAPKRAAGRKRRCPSCDGEGEFPSYTVDGEYFACQTCQGTGEVEDSSATESPAIEPDPESRGTPPLGPQARSGEALRFKDWEDLQCALELVHKYAFYRRPSEETKALVMLRDVTRAGFIVSRTGDGERVKASEHRGPNDQAEASPDEL